MRRIAAFVAAILLIPSLNSRAQAQTTRPSDKTTAAQAKSQPPKMEAGRAAKAAQADVARALGAKLPETKWSNVRLEDAVAFLQDASGANIHVNWRALETVNITRETPVTVRVQSLPLRKVLKYLLTEADGAGLITFYAEDGVIEITTKELADQRMITKVYPVEDLMLAIPDFTDAPQFQLQQQGQTSGRGGGGGGGQSLISGNTTTEQNTTAGRAQRGQELVQLVMDTVQPEIWRENGGTASIRYFRGKLIVTAPRSVHEQIGGAIQ